MRTLVTGGAGFIGSHLAGRLIRGGYDVRLLDNLSSGTWAPVTAIRQEVEAVAGTPRDEAAVRRATAGDVRHSAADIAAARKALGFAPAVSLEEGLARTLGSHQAGS